MEVLVEALVVVDEVEVVEVLGTLTAPGLWLVLVLGLVPWYVECRGRKGPWAPSRSEERATMTYTSSGSRSPARVAIGAPIATSS